MRRASQLLFGFGVLLLLLQTARDVRADTFDATWNGADGSGSATLTATLLSGDEYIVTAITSGEQGGSSISLLAPGSYAANDNDIYYPSSQELDFGGLAFSVGTIDYGLYFDTDSATSPSLYNTYDECTSAINACDTVAFDDASSVNIAFSLTPVTSTATPEPGGIILLSLALIGLVGLGWRNRVVANLSA